MKRLLLALGLSAWLLSTGCNFPELRTAATEPHPTTGLTPPQQLVQSVPGVVGNPLDFAGWSNILESLVVLGAAGFGVKEWRKFRRTGASPIK